MESSNISINIFAMDMGVGNYRTLASLKEFKVVLTYLVACLMACL